MLSQTVMWAVDSAMVGHTGKIPLAAVGMGGIMVWTIHSFFVGVMNGINTFVAQYHGGKKFEKCAIILWQGLYLALLSGLVIYLIRIINPLTVNLLGPADEVRSRTLSYANIRMLSAPFVVLHFAYSNFFRGIGNTKTPMKVIAFANLVNIAGDYLLIFGRGFVPAMGVAGAAWATALANFLAALSFCIISFSKRYRNLYQIHRCFRINTDEMMKLLRVGLPIGVQFFLDMGSFLVFFAFIGRISTTALAANQIIIQLLAFSFMPAQGLAVAATTLMGQYIGSGSSIFAKKSAYSALKIGLIYSIFIAASYIIFAGPLVRIFATDITVIAMGKKLMLIAAVFQFFDSIQMISNGALRGAGDTKLPMIITVCFAWFLFLPLAFYFGMTLNGGVTGAWAGAVLYIIILASVIFTRLHREGWISIRI